MKCPKCDNKIFKYSELKSFYSMWFLPKKNPCPKCGAIIEPDRLRTLFGLGAAFVAVANLLAMALLGKFSLSSTVFAFFLLLLSLRQQKVNVIQPHEN